MLRAINTFNRSKSIGVRNFSLFNKDHYLIKNMVNYRECMGEFKESFNNNKITIGSKTDYDLLREYNKLNIDNKNVKKFHDSLVECKDRKIFDCLPYYFSKRLIFSNMFGLFFTGFDLGNMLVYNLLTIFPIFWSLDVGIGEYLQLKNKMNKEISLKKFLDEGRDNTENSLK